MEDSLRRAWKRFWDDIRHRRHIESYVVSALLIVFAVLSIVEDLLNTQMKLAALMAGVGLLVYNMTIPEGGDTRRLDDFLNDRSSFTPLPERLKNAKTLWIYAPSAINILNEVNTQAIQRQILSHPEGNLRVMIQDPEKTQEVARLKKQLDENVKYQMQDLPGAIQDTLKLLGKMTKWEKRGLFEYRLLAFNPGFSMIVIDPDKKTGVVIVEFYGFTHEHTASRMHIEITRDQSERWYTYWVEQYDAMWKEARSPEVVDAI